MAEYPNNSHSAREKSTATAAGKTEKKLDKVVTGAAKTKKKSEARRFLNIFAPDDAENVKSSILSDVIVPGVKAAIADVIRHGAHRQQEKRRFQNCLPEILR